MRTSPYSVISSLVLPSRDFTIIAQKESLLAGKRWLDLLAGVEFVDLLSVTTIDCFVLQCKIFYKKGETYLTLHLINSFFFSFQFQHFTLRTLVNRFHSTHIYGPSPSFWGSPLELKTSAKVTEIHLE